MARYRCLPPCTHSTNSATIHQLHIQRCRYGVHMADDCWNTSCPHVRRERCTPVSDRYSRPCKHPKSTKHKPQDAEPSARYDPPAPRSTTARRNPNAPESCSSRPPHTFYSIPRLPATCCHLCSAHLLTPDLLDRHIERHHTCPEPTCREYPVNVWSHYSTYHVPDRGTKPCRFLRCRVRFPVYGRINEQILKDIATHMDSAHARCPLCDRYFFDSSRLDKHFAMSSLHQDQDLACRCMDCSAEFKTFQSLASHVCRIPCGDAEARCSAVFTNKADLEKHERRRRHGTYRKTTRDDNDEANCVACGRSFQGTAGIVSHLESGKCNPE